MKIDSSRKTSTLFSECQKLKTETKCWKQQNQKKMLYIDIYRYKRKSIYFLEDLQSTKWYSPNQEKGVIVQNSMK